ncbi:MAG: hypothetical protein ACRDTT_10395 [Pseudonocardiaceae bacterium]
MSGSGRMPPAPHRRHEQHRRPLRLRVPHDLRSSRAREHLAALTVELHKRRASTSAQLARRATALVPA